MASMCDWSASDYTTYDMSRVGPAASLISTVADLNRFYAMLLAGEIVNPSSLAQMRTTVPVISGWTAQW